MSLRNIDKGGQQASNMTQGRRLARFKYQGDFISITSANPALTCEYCEEHDNYEEEHTTSWKGDWRWVILKSYCGHLIARRQFDDDGEQGDFAVVWTEDGTEVKDEVVCAAQQTWEDEA
tara:strand:- start:41059 stop:41415 length:357 start_codon:yes stop_codon:yes gene_type:complete